MLDIGPDYHFGKSLFLYLIHKKMEIVFHTQIAIL